MRIKIVIWVILLIAFLSACDVFPTREPEKPNNLHQKFIPATTQNILLENFAKAINTSDYTNYANCLAAKSNGQSKEFEFVSSSDVASIYASLFASWRFSEESRNFKSIIANIKAESNPNVVISKQEFSEVSADSTVLTAHYELFTNFKDENESQVYRGNLLLSIYRETNGIWFISRWTDLQDKNNIESQSWSKLKVKFSN